MTRIQERHRLDALLADGIDPSEPADVVALLAAYQVETDAAQRARIVELLRDEMPSSDEFHEYVIHTPNGPSDQLGEEAWIRRAETIGLAIEAARELADLLGQVESLLATSSTLMLAFEDRIWTNPLVAAESREGPFTDVFPWDRIQSGIASGLLRPDAPVRAEILDAWLEDRLHVEDANALQDWVSAGAWQEAYRARITELASRAGVCRLDVERSMSVAADDSELDSARLIQDLPLPHLGHRACREARLHAQGTVWRLRNTKDDRRVLLDYGAERLEWDDAVLGTLVTELGPLPVDDLGLAEDALSSVVRLARGESHPRAKTIAINVANDLAGGAVHAGVVSAAKALDEAKLETDRECRWVACALGSGLELETVGHRLDDDELDQALQAANVALLPYKSALMLLDEEEYREIVRGYDLDSEAWSGARQQLDEDVPTAYVYEALAGLAQAARSENDDVVSLSAYRARVDQGLHAADGDGLGYEVVAAAASARSPGDVDLLVTVGDDAPIGRVLRISVKVGAGEAFGDCKWFAPVARDAVRAAYAAAGSACPDGIPPYPLEAHRIVVHNPGEITGIDGTSLGLALCLGFASAWLGKVVPEDLAATGSVYNRGKGWRIGAVDHVPAKAAGLYAHAGQQGRRLMAHAEHKGDIVAFDHEAVVVDSVAEALATAELDLRGSKNRKGAWPDRKSRIRALNELIDTVEDQELDSFTPWGDPWRLVADRIAQLLDGLTPRASDADTIPRARAYGALAYVHAGDPKAAGRLLRGGEDEWTTPFIALVRQTVALDKAIDDAAWDECAKLRDELGDSLQAAQGQAWASFAGHAWGTIGRSLLHARQFETAIPWFERAVAHHAEHAPHETGRSRVYLSAALRRLGRLGDATAQLNLAACELEDHTKGESVPYYHQCRAYLLYERARIEVARDDAEFAVASAEAALEFVRRQGFWPALGILRTLAWAHRLRSDADAADSCVEQMEKLKVPDAHRELRARLLEEAEGLPVADGEVY